MAPNKLILLFGYCCWSITLWAQSTYPIHFHQLATENDLSQSRITALFQDSYGFMWIGTTNGLNLYNGYSFKRYYFDSDNANSLSSNLIKDIWEDANQNIWVSTYSKSLNRFNRQTEIFERFPEFPVKEISVHPTNNTAVFVSANKAAMFRLDMESETTTSLLDNVAKDCPLYASYDNLLEDRKGQIWFSNWQTLFLYQPEQQHIKCFEATPHPNSLSNSYVSAIYEDRKGTIWIGTLDGMNRWNPISEDFEVIRPLDYLTNTQNVDLNYILSFAEDAKGNLWLGTPAGLLYFDQQNQTFTNFEAETSDLPRGAIEDLLIDETGVLWIGTETGLTLLYPNAQQFDRGVHDLLFPTSQLTQAAYKSNKILKSPMGDYWMSTTKGLFRINKNGQQYQHQKIITGNFHGLNQTKEGVIYAGALGKGVYEIKPNQTPKLRLSTAKQFEGGYIYDIIEDQQGNIWTAAIGELSRYNPKTNTYVYFTQKKTKTPTDLDVSYVLDLHLDQRGDMWLATPKGLHLLAKSELAKPFGMPLNFQSFYHETNNPTSLSTDNIAFIFESEKGAIWIGTESGLNEYQDGQFVRYNQTLGNIAVLSMLEDNQANFWLGTSKGLYHLQSDHQIFTNYTVSDGLPSNRFLLNNCLKESDGTLVFSTENGVISFLPDVIAKNPTPPPVLITDFKLYNQSVKVGAKDALLQKPIYLNEKINLAYEQNVLTFEFSALNFLDASANEYAYQLVGFDEDWQYIGNQRSVTFTNLDEGTYTLQVKAANNDGVWNEKITKLTVQISPPWYRTWWAYGLWLAISTGILYAFYYFQLTRRLAQAETVRLKELDSLKTNLYTNITHEFRTPLTVILGMAKKIGEQPKQWVAKGTALIKRNGENLLQLVNQMLDLAKLEAGKLPIHLVQADLIPFLQYLVEAFHSYAEAKGVQLHFLPEMDHLEMDYDAEKMQSILTNLISNAVKFTPTKGSIYVQVRELANQKIQLKVKDTGVGIPPDALANIFQRYYQLEQNDDPQATGTGIGLELTKGLVELLGGTIEVKSSVGKGTTFIIELPIEKNAPKTANIQPTFKPLSEATTLDEIEEHSTAPTLLIVEDNEDVIQYLMACLSKKYQLLIAKDGQAGIDKAEATLPSLIISDVMMPKKNGFELCETLKTNALTSHIPIILLTARADIDSKIAGLNTGADAYLPKPFNETELLVRIKKLLELRKKLQAYYTSTEFLEQPINQENPDAIFLKELQNFIQQEIASPNLDILLLHKKMAVSRTAFYTKVNALVGMPPGEYIRLIRLNHAKKLLRQTDLTITEIAYQCGFSSQSLFSRTFSAKEGVSPSVYRGKLNH